jgi:hypothetical protein
VEHFRHAFCKFLGGFTFIPEFRIDNASQAVFVDKEGAAKKSASNFLLAAVYSF